ncbi:MAG: proteasome accessory factor PafA2 family protein [Nitrospira sp.]|nr:proteasome accessory factor PafA2 family protein [Nitrospira sp.]
MPTCEYATALKIGTTRLVLDLIERGALPPLEVEQPVVAVKQVSRDPEIKTMIRLKDGRKVSALELQTHYCEIARRELAGSDEESDWLLSEWAETLHALSEDRSRLVGKLDWVTKLWLIETFMREERIGWDDPLVGEPGLGVSQRQPEQGLYLGLEAEGKTWRLTTEDGIEEALSERATGYSWRGAWVVCAAVF